MDFFAKVLGSKDDQFSPRHAYVFFYFDNVMLSNAHLFNEWPLMFLSRVGMFWFLVLSWLNDHVVAVGLFIISKSWRIKHITRLSFRRLLVHTR